MGGGQGTRETRGGGGNRATIRTRVLVASKPRPVPRSILLRASATVLLSQGQETQKSAGSRSGLKAMETPEA